MTPTPEMQKRIVSAFRSTWSAIGADVLDCFKEQARMGDTESKRVVREGDLTPSEAYEAIVDHLYAYNDDDEAFEAWQRWHAADFDGSRKAVEAQLTGVGW